MVNVLGGIAMHYYASMCAEEGMAARARAKREGRRVGSVGWDPKERNFIICWVMLPLILSGCAFVYRENTKVGATGFPIRVTADDVAAGIRLEGRTAFVSDATAGAGWETARVLAAGGAHVLVGGSTAHEARGTVETLRRETTEGKFSPLPCGTSNLDAVRACAEAARAALQESGAALDVLILNARSRSIGAAVDLSAFPLTLGINHLAHFELSKLLLPLLLQAAAPRVVVIPSVIAKPDPTSQMGSYVRVGGTRWLTPLTELGRLMPFNVPEGGAPDEESLAELLRSAADEAAAGAALMGHVGDTILASALHARELQNRYGAQGLAAFAVDAVNFCSKITAGRKMQCASRGAATQVYCALLAPADQSGSMFRNMEPASLGDPRLQAILDDPRAPGFFWEHSTQLAQGA
ncbi:hypothetical protein EMIHUDRAFT_223857 [Emiliania huxleyi CCMP1516]|uniref:Uncharacterized protein n=2 Tax=Emiliania huxleyi TaxID=2903 RepID=A0A0D3KTC4_EMIH1|nr:hypothetical protein EMIHUDRAFT_223857 [Emiliania huxleyi CCMP1516]EOD39009.1 hypothetical protein EMIHUDRAFT_223857 [Emiliania huxleyi CCMP1516]|eukprot:XP_005791438.1 hypothetical protein EMIHUDRAFT_223857 [Emiliania huxleyi CCMP1516]